MTPTARSTSLTHCLSVAAVASVLACATAASDAAIVPNPASIVDHGSYITDVAHGRDWYKFSNADSTIGRSFEYSLFHFAAGGWTGASIAAVQGLEAQFGWTSDTPGAYSTANYGLTDAMASFLGYTRVIFFNDGDETHSFYGITSDQIYFGDVGAHVVTQDETYQAQVPGFGTAYYGDAVDGFNDSIAFGGADASFGVWLTRASVVPDDTGPGAAAVPEPGTWMLILGGVIAAIAERWRIVRQRRIAA